MGLGGRSKGEEGEVIKKGEDVKRGAHLHVVEGSRAFWVTGPKKSAPPPSGWWC